MKICQELFADLKRALKSRNLVAARGLLLKIIDQGCQLRFFDAVEISSYLKEKGNEREAQLWSELSQLFKRVSKI